jgi:hypothetical protein
MRDAADADADEHLTKFEPGIIKHAHWFGPRWRPWFCTLEANTQVV